MQSILFRRLIVAALAALCAIGWLVHMLGRSDVVMLIDDGNAHWIRADRPFEISEQVDTDSSVEFSRQIELSQPQAQITLRMKALRRAVVIWDGQPVIDTGPQLDHWKQIRTVWLPATSAGVHQLRCVVTNANGPALLWIAGDQPGFNSDEKWTATLPNRPPASAVRASRLWEKIMPPRYQLSAGDLLSMLPLVFGCFVAGVLLCRFCRSGFLASPAFWRWIMMGVVALIDWNNLFKLSVGFGYDPQAHYDYIAYIAKHLSLPRPDAGWQMFQPPVYYVASAIFARLIAAMGVAAQTVPYLLRLVPMVCGIVLVECGYRIGRLVFGGRKDLTLITTGVCAFAPVNLYMTQSVSNEPFAAACCGLLTLITLTILAKPQRAGEWKWSSLAGVLLGICFVSKVSSMVWIVPLGWVLAMSLRQERASTIRWLKTACAFVIPLLLICGWFVIRNQRLVGRALVLETAVARSTWWQDPGYRTPSNLYEFGHVFSRPFYNVSASLWDSLYSTFWGDGIVSGEMPWNLRLSWIVLWLALPPSVLLLIGIGRSVGGHKNDVQQNSLQFATLTLLCFVAAVFQVYLRLPIYSCGKASYFMGATPCIGVLIAGGFDVLCRNQWTRGLFGALLICWAMVCAINYFVML